MPQADKSGHKPKRRAQHGKGAAKKDAGEKQKASKAEKSRVSQPSTVLRLRALATDYDGTLAHNGSVTETTLDALKRLKQAGYRLILVTGRELNDLISIFPEIVLFD